MSSFDMEPLTLRLPNAVPWALACAGPFDAVSLDRFMVQPAGGGRAWAAGRVQGMWRGVGKLMPAWPPVGPWLGTA